MKLLPRRVEKPWGQQVLPALFGPSDGRRVGEIWFEHPDQPPMPLLAKYLFTSDRLSVQVHPPADATRSDGAPCGKNECWYVIDAKEDAEIGLGLRRNLSPADVRSAAADGSIEHELAWKRVRAGDFVFVPAGTIHSIGAGLTILELQQNCDVTYRLFDFGRPRELQLDAALDVARLQPDDGSLHVPADPQGDRILISVPQFTVAQIVSDDGAQWLADRWRWVLPIAGSVRVADEEVAASECLLAAPGAPLELGANTLVVIAADGALDESDLRVVS